MGTERKIIRYAVGIDKDKSTDEEIVLSYRSILVSNTPVKHYGSCLNILIGLSKNTRALLDFILVNMSEENYIHNNNQLKSRFKEIFVKADIKVNLKDNTINKAFTELKNHKLILKPYKSARGLYRINPQFFWKGTEKDRIRLIRRIKESPFLTENNKIRREYFKNR